MPSSTYSLYAHIPFCDVLCSYCAFNVIIGRDDLIPSFVQALQHEMRLIHLPDGASSHTFYLGGGTPSTLAPEHIAALIDTARQSFDLHPQAEITIEANPNTPVDYLHGYRQAGVNRLSLGVQSLNADQLALFRRTHSAAQAEAAFAAVRDAGFDNVSLDLIFGAPHQTLPMWRATLDDAIAWRPEHFSLYGLILEPHTRLTRYIQRGDLPAPDDDLAADMYDTARHALISAGYEQYEIASFALPGFESQHNQQYWHNLPYLGLGPGAHGWVAPHRYWNMRPVPGYVRTFSGKVSPDFPFSPALDDYETIPTELEMIETLILGLRLVRDGVDLSAFARRFGERAEVRFGPAIADLRERGLLTQTGDTLRLTERAYLISNRVFVNLLPDL